MTAQIEKFLKFILTVEFLSTKRTLYLESDFEIKVG